MNELQICNSALVKIGASTILSVEDKTKPANLCKVQFPVALRAVLRMHPWSKATRRVTISPESTPPAFDYAQQFILPSDFIRLTFISTDDYEIEGNKILCNDDTLQLKFVYFPSDVSVLDALCAESIAFYLAWDISYALTQSGSVKEQIWGEFVKFLKNAKSVDSQEKARKSLEANTFLDARLQAP
jgi:hypothetical protein